MLVDYIIDSEYVARVLRNELRNLGAYITRLYQILAYENGRLIVGVNPNGQILPESTITHWLHDAEQNSFSIGFEESESPKYIAQLFDEELWNCRPLKSNGRFVFRKAVIDLEQRGDDSAQDFLYKKLKDAKPRANFYITDRGNEYSKPCHVKIDSYFSIDRFVKYEGDRIKCLMMQSFCNKTSDILKAVLERFGAGVSKFIVIDGYCLFVNNNNQAKDVSLLLQEKLNTLFVWLRALCKASAGSIEIDVHSRLNCEEELKRAEMCEYIKECLTKFCKGGITQITIQFMNGAEIHDRFICSNTHYFSIGRGLDGMNNSDFSVKSTINLFYCGRFNENDAGNALEIHEVLVRSKKCLSVHVSTEA